MTALSTIQARTNGQTPHKYYYERFLNENRRMTIDTVYGRNSNRHYFSSFKTVSRDKREQEEMVRIAVVKLHKET